MTYPCLGVKEGFHEGQTFRLRSEERELDVTRPGQCKQSTSGEENSMCKGPEVAGSWVCEILQVTREGCRGEGGGAWTVGPGPAHQRSCPLAFFFFFFLMNLFIYLFIFGCIGSSLLHTGFL